MIARAQNTLQYGEMTNYQDTMLVYAPWTNELLINERLSMRMLDYASSTNEPMTNKLLNQHYP